MKTTYKYILTTLAVAGSLVACSPEEFEGVSETGIPQASAFGGNVKIDVDQSLNQVCLKLDAPAVYPIWTITLPNGKEEKTTVNGYTKIYTNAGDYTVTMQVGNHNGISDGIYTTTFHIDNTLIDFGKYTTILSKADWHMANKEKGHLACGESGSDGTNWWSGDADCKANEGLYDNQLTFAEDYSYTFEPGNHGTIYVNKGVTVWPDFRNPDEDYNVPVEAQTSTYGLEVDGDDLYITFPKGTYFPYIANDYIWENPRYKVINLTPKKMTLLIDEPGVIAWQYILTTEDTVERAFAGFTYDQPDNIWKQAEITAGGIYYADAGWAPYPDVVQDEIFSVTNQEVNINLVKGTASQWQAQFPLITNIGPGSPLMTSGKNYDFSCVISASKDLNGMTLKLVETGENGVPGSLGIAYDANAVFYNNETNLKAYEDYVFYLVDQPGVDIQDNLLQLVLDFGGCEEGTEVTIKNIVLIEHALNKELDQVPAEGGNGEGGGDEPTPGVIWDESANLLANMNIDLSYYYAPNWSPIDNPELTQDGGSFTWFLPEATFDRWQAQHTFNNIGVAATIDKSYDIRLKVVSNNDIPGLTVKFTQQDNDNVFLTEDRHDISAYEETWIEIVDVRPYNNESKECDTDITNLKIVIDAGGNPAETEFTISDIHMQEHQGPKEQTWNAEDNIWTEAIEIGSYNAQGGDWHTPDEPMSYEVNADGTYSISLPSESNDRWQAQFQLFNNIATSADNKYDFRVILNPTIDVPAVTVKWVSKADDKVFYTDDRHDIVAYEDNVITLLAAPGIDMDDLSLVLDFGGNAPGTEILVSGIHVQVAK